MKTFRPTVVPCKTPEHMGNARNAQHYEVTPVNLGTSYLYRRHKEYVVGGGSVLA